MMASGEYYFVFVIPVAATVLFSPFISKAVRENDKTGYVIAALIVICLLIIGNALKR